MGESIGIYLSDKLIDGAKKRSADTHKGKLSAYIQDLIERDLAGIREADALSKDVLTSLCRQLRPELLGDFEAAIAKVEISEARLLAELIHLVVDYAEAGGEFHGDRDPFIGSTQIPNIAKACARARARDSLSDDLSTIRRHRGDFAELLRRIADHAGLDKPDPTKDLGDLIFEAERLFKAVRDLPAAPYPVVDEGLDKIAAEDPPSIFRKPPKPPSTGTTP